MNCVFVQCTKSKNAIFTVCLQKVKIYATNHVFPNIFHQLHMNSRMQLFVDYFSLSLILNYWLTALMALHMEAADTGPLLLSINGACWENCARLKPQGALRHQVPFIVQCYPPAVCSTAWCVDVLVVSLCSTKQPSLPTVFSDTYNVGSYFRKRSHIFFLLKRAFRF